MVALPRKQNAARWRRSHRSSRIRRYRFTCITLGSPPALCSASTSAGITRRWPGRDTLGRGTASGPRAHRVSGTKSMSARHVAVQVQRRVCQKAPPSFGDGGRWLVEHPAADLGPIPAPMELDATRGRPERPPFATDTCDYASLRSLRRARGGGGWSHGGEHGACAAGVRSCLHGRRPSSGARRGSALPIVPTLARG